MPNSLLAQGLQHTRLPCPSLSLGDISLQGVQVQSLVRELRSHMQCSAAKTFKKQKNNSNNKKAVQLFLSSRMWNFTLIEAKERIQGDGGKGNKSPEVVGSCPPFPLTILSFMRCWLPRLDQPPIPFLSGTPWCNRPKRQASFPRTRTWFWSFPANVTLFLPHPSPRLAHPHGPSRRKSREVQCSLHFPSTT